MPGLEHYVGQTLDDKYRLEHLLGQGGMGAVYLATHLGTERYVALKLISPQFMRNKEFVERFKREARAAGRLRHPNVVDVTDFGFARVGAERVAYLVMEYLDGCTLGDVLAEEERLPPPRAASAEDLAADTLLYPAPGAAPHARADALAAAPDEPDAQVEENE